MNTWILGCGKHLVAESHQAISKTGYIRLRSRCEQERLGCTECPTPGPVQELIGIGKHLDLRILRKGRTGRRRSVQYFIRYAAAVGIQELDNGNVVLVLAARQLVAQRCNGIDRTAPFVATVIR